MGRVILINKSLIYFLVFSLLLGFTILPKIIKAITYPKTQGVVRHFIYFQSKSRRNRTTWYPLVDFKVNDVQYSCYGSRYQRTMSRKKLVSGFNSI